MMDHHALLAFIVMLVLTINSLYYLRCILRKQVSAHAFSWIIWFLTQAIGGSAQYVKGGGAGSWPMFYGALLCLPIALLALFYHGERKITRGDWACFIGSILAIPVWLATDNPLWASIIVAFIDAVGGIVPTLRKSWRNPHEESLFLFATATTNYLLCIFALESLSATTLTYPVSMGITHGLVVLVLLLRRRKTKTEG